MVIASLKDTEKYESLHPLFHKVFEYIKTHDLHKMPIGKIEIEGEKAFILISEITTKPAEEARTETHHHHLDIQIPLSASETMGWLALEKCQTPTEVYNADSDIAFWIEKPTMYFELKPGEFAIFFPHDGHAPGIGKGAIKKAVVKMIV